MKPDQTTNPEIQQSGGKSSPSLDCFLPKADHWRDTVAICENKKCGGEYIWMNEEKERIRCIRCHDGWIKRIRRNYKEENERVEGREGDAPKSN